jgi:hypothetical protein
MRRREMFGARAAPNFVFLNLIEGERVLGGQAVVAVDPVCRLVLFPRIY